MVDWVGRFVSGIHVFSIFCKRNVVRIRTLIGLKLVLFFLAGVISAQDAPVPAVPTAIPVSATPIPAASTTVTRSTGTMARKLQPQSVTISLLDGMKLSGELTEVDQWSMKTSFGTTNLPLSTVAGMRMAQEGNAMTTVVLHNGDNLTGAVQLDQVVIQTEWGRAEINGNHVASILFTPGLKWASETGLNGMRWKLITEEPPRTVPAAPGVPGQPGQPGRPGTVPTQPRPGVQPGVRQ
jgi:sRNA-binding regulator protein Hfq